MKVTGRMKMLRGPVGIFCLVLCYFVLRSAWYEPAQIVVRGKLLADRSTLEIRWDSGAGFNSYERKRFSLARLPAHEGKKHQIVVRRLQENNPSSLSKDVFIGRIAVDGRNLDLPEMAKKSGYQLHDDSLRLTEGKKELTLEVEAGESILVEMLTNNLSGKVSVGIDGVFRDSDLYVANEKGTSLPFEQSLVGENGGFVVKSAMPRYRIKSLQVRNTDVRGQLAVSSIDLETGGKTVPFFSGAQGPFADTLLHGVSKAHKRYFSVTQFMYDVVFAALTTWLIVALLNRYRSCGGLSGVFSGPRRVFWLFLVGSLTTYNLWLLAFWPGVASVDSLKIWRAAILPGVYLNDHPLLNVMLYKYLAHIWNNMAVVPLFHIVLLSVLVASVFYSLLRRGIPLKWLVPFYLLLLLSLPLGLYNTVLWKDIPFALITVFWGYILVMLYLKRVDGTLRYSGQQIAVLFFLLAAVALIRHNGVVYLIVIPLYFIALRLVSLRFAAFSLLAAAGSVGIAVIFLTHGGGISGGYFLSQGAGFLQNFLDKSVANLLAHAWRDYWQIFNINQKATAWDLFHLFLGDRTAYQFLHAAGWNDVYPYLQPGQALVPALNRLAMTIYHKSYEIPYVYFTWNAVPFLGLYLLVILLIRRFPAAAIFSSFILVQVFTLLVFVDVMNWRYYYFAFLGGYLLVPVMLLDLPRRCGQKKGMVHEI